MAPGQLLNVWCHGCHSKLRIAAESVKFTSLQPSGVDTGKLHKIIHKNVYQGKKVILMFCFTGSLDLWQTTFYICNARI